MMQRHFMVGHKMAMPTLSACTCFFEGQQQNKIFAIIVLRCGRPTGMGLGNVDCSCGPASTIKD